jgi:hypothetical protein
VAVNAVADLSLGYSQVIDGNADDIEDADGNLVVVDGGTDGWQTATGEVASVVGQVDGSASGVVPVFTQEAAAYALGVGAVNATIDAITQVAEGSKARDAILTLTIGPVLCVMRSTYDQPAKGGGGGKGKGGGPKKRSDADFYDEAFEQERQRLLKKLKAKKAKAPTEDDEEDEELTDEEFDMIIEALHERQAQEKHTKRNALWAALKAKSLH